MGKRVREKCTRVHLPNGSVEVYPGTTKANVDEFGRLYVLTANGKRTWGLHPTGAWTHITFDYAEEEVKDDGSRT